MRFEILTIFPGFFAGIFEHGIVRRALASGLVEVGIHDLREFTEDRHRTVDDRPFGGGEGMVLKPEPVAKALSKLHILGRSDRALQVLLDGDRAEKLSVALMSAQGRPFTQETARALSRLDRVVLICGRYEGVDERVNTLYCDREISIGDYVLSGGELAAAVVVDAVMRLVPGVLGNQASGEFESFGVPDAEIEIGGEIEGGPGTGIGQVPRSQHGSGGLLDYPHYTRPAEWNGMAVPEVLLGGDHLAIRKWRRERQLRKTLENRPDLLERAERHGALSAEDLRILDRIRTES